MRKELERQIQKICGSPTNHNLVANFDFTRKFRAFETIVKIDWAIYLKTPKTYVLLDEDHNTFTIHLTSRSTINAEFEDKIAENFLITYGAAEENLEQLLQEYSRA